MTELPDVEDPPRPSTFSLDGRAAPALYLIGWVGTVMGFAVLAVSFMATGSAAAPWVFLAGLLVLTTGLVSAAGSQAIERGRRTDLAYRGPSPVLALVVVIALTLVAVLLVLAPLSALGVDPRSPLATALSLLVTTLVYVAVLRLLVVGPGALSWGEMGLRAPVPDAVRDLVLGGFLAVPVLGATLVLGGLLARFVEPAPSVLPESVDTLALLANLASAAVLAPVGEELFFRGFATTAWARVVGARAAIVRGAVFFAIAHVVTLADVSFATGVQRALFSFLALLPVGLTLGWVFLSRRSLYAAIGLHAAFNGLQVLALFAAGRAV
ncbi:MAG: type II CAAX endopeptidase family protein [Chloroflexota bacterium]